MPIYYHVTIVEATCVIYLRVVWKVMPNLCSAAYVAFLLKTAKPVFNLMEYQLSGTHKHGGKSKKANLDSVSANVRVRSIDRTKLFWQTPA